jgi:CheY-like chemotaxis protein
MISRYVIFADDDADDMELITGFLKEFDNQLRVFEFKDGKEVITFLDGSARGGQPPLLIILDVNMPRLNGKETLATIRRHPVYRHVPVVLYTTSNNESDLLYCKQLDASFINKPNGYDGVRQVAKMLAEFCQQAASD